MKISIEDQELFTISDLQRKVICDYMSEDIFEEDMKRRFQWVFAEIYKESFKQLKNRWMKVIETRYETIPTDPDKLAELIFSQPDYQCRKSRGDQIS